MKGSISILLITLMVIIPTMMCAAFKKMENKALKKFQDAERAVLGGIMYESRNAFRALVQTEEKAMRGFITSEKKAAAEISKTIRNEYVNIIHSLTPFYVEEDLEALLDEEEAILMKDGTIVGLARDVTKNEITLKELSTEIAKAAKKISKVLKKNEKVDAALKKLAEE